MVNMTVHEDGSVSFSRKTSIKEMCEYIVEIIELTQPIYKGKITPEEIYHYSPTGELFHVFELYEWAESNDPRRN